MQPQVIAFTTSYNGITNVLRNEVHISKAFDPSSISKPLNLKDFGAKTFTAIWDTGATNSVITKKVVNDCGLKPIGMARVHTPKGEGIAPVYLASVFLTNKVVVPQLRMAEGDLAGDSEVLIGMDIISQGDFAVTNKDGKRFHLEYRLLNA